MPNLNLKGIWIPIEILIDDKLSDKERITQNVMAELVSTFLVFNKKNYMECI